MELLPSFIEGWQFTRSETLELLGALTPDQLSYRPSGEHWQPIYHQFGCLTRTQLIYAAAVTSGAMDFSLFSLPSLPSKDSHQDRHGIEQALQAANDTWLAALSSPTAAAEITWPDHTRPLARHVASLAEHERLHHGQLIAYFTLASITLPPKFKANWAL